MRSMRSQIRTLQHLEPFSLPHRALTQTPRFVHSSSRYNVSASPIPKTTAPQMLPSDFSPQSVPPPESAPSRPAPSVLSKLPISSVLRSYLIMRMSSSPALLTFCFNVLRRMLDSKSYLTSIERNPVLAKLLKGTFYAQFCAGETASEVKANTMAAKQLLGYDGMILEFALEVLGGTKPTEAEIKQELEVWKKGMMQSVDVAQEGDFIGLKWSGLGRHALWLLQNNQPATPEMWEAITTACDAAAAKGVSIAPGAEEEITNLGLESWNLELQKRYNTKEQGRAVIYTTYQCYLRGISKRLADHLAKAQEGGYIAGVKLVRGAYLAHEPKELTFDTIEGTHANYDACAEAVLKGQWSDVVPAPAPSTPFPAVNVVLATHNLASVQKAQAIRATQLVASPPESLPRLTYAQLQGMADEITQQLVQNATQKADKQAKVVKCMTWGTTTECLNFLLRRASENKEAAMRTEDTRRAMGAELMRRFKGVLGFA
ncbi:carbapenem antibiotics biosynthesis protein card [Lophiotrema nucula]|uniref:Proline dehydrogenase n=1 Tax=Lophiotrema nucula TaxID=690887 RepID=A0A6A5ZMX9_9PLEO|nr:carbapenem antibiotics biosynthesis protein card [Lophiotrema nucula]